VNPSLCFVIMPCHGGFQRVYQEAIGPAIDRAGLSAKRADHERRITSVVMRGIWDDIWAARVVVADITDGDPHVLYELGLCHALGVSTVLVQQARSNPPFDGGHLRCVTYDPSDLAGLRRELEDLLRQAIAGDAGQRDRIGLPWPYPAVPAPGVADGLARLEASFPWRRMLQAGLVLPLGEADTHFLQVLLYAPGACVLQRTAGGAVELSVVFDDSAACIRRRQAKSALQETIDGFGDKAARRQQLIDDVLYGDSGVVDVAGGELPFRFANGGVLPIVAMNDRQYYVLFYRETAPVGWNIANGASDSSHELWHPDGIIEREFGEELAAVDRGSRTWYAVSGPRGGIDRSETDHLKSLWSRLFERGADSNAGAGGIANGTWQRGELAGFMTKRLPVAPLPGPDSLRLQPPSGAPLVTSGIFLNISAADCSIELDRIVIIPFDERLLLLDGEILDGVVLNRPIGLFPVEAFDAGGHWLHQREFFPERLFHFGAAEVSSPDGCRLVCARHIERLVRTGLATKEQKRSWDAHPRRFDLCPVTRGIIRRHRASATAAVR
jgi:hypothetical protein